MLASTIASLKQATSQDSNHSVRDSSQTIESPSASQELLALSSSQTSLLKQRLGEYQNVVGASGTSQPAALPPNERQPQQKQQHKAGAGAAAAAVSAAASSNTNARSSSRREMLVSPPPPPLPPPRSTRTLQTSRVADMQQQLPHALFRSCM